MDQTKVSLVVVMGPSGCGKTTIAQNLAAHFSVEYLEGDQFHPPNNINKMSNGIPLCDEDRWPWLASIRDHCSAIAAELRSTPTTSPKVVVVTCSALKKSYRDFLRQASGFDHIYFVFPKGSYQLIATRMEKRQGHFMKATMLESQLATLEMPDSSEPDIITVDSERDIKFIIDQVLQVIS